MVVTFAATRRADDRALGRMLADLRRDVPTIIDLHPALTGNGFGLSASALADGANDDHAYYFIANRRERRRAAPARQGC